jgi:hypothetical protein
MPLWRLVKRLPVGMIMASQSSWLFEGLGLTPAACGGKERFFGDDSRLCLLSSPKNPLSFPPWAGSQATWIAELSDFFKGEGK